MNSTTVAMTKLELIKLISDLSNNKDHTAAVVIDGRTVTLKEVSNLYLGSILAIFESDEGESVSLEITESEDFDGPVLAKILDTKYDELID